MTIYNSFLKNIYKILRKSLPKNETINRIVSLVLTYREFIEIIYDEHLNKFIYKMNTKDIDDFMPSQSSLPNISSNGCTENDVKILDAIEKKEAYKKIGTYICEKFNHIEDEKVKRVFFDYYFNTKASQQRSMQFVRWNNNVSKKEAVRLINAAWEELSYPDVFCINPEVCDV